MFDIMVTFVILGGTTFGGDEFDVASFLVSSWKVVGVVHRKF